MVSFRDYDERRIVLPPGVFVRVVERLEKKKIDEEYASVSTRRCRTVPRRFYSFDLWKSRGSF